MRADDVRDRRAADGPYRQFRYSGNLSSQVDWAGIVTTVPTTSKVDDHSP
jgi:hypothetical protein